MVASIATFLCVASSFTHSRLLKQEPDGEWKCPNAYNALGIYADGDTDKLPVLSPAKLFVSARDNSIQLAASLPPNIAALIK